MTRAKWYVGSRGGHAVPFTATAEPTRETHGANYHAVMGPFRTRRAAILTAETHPNPHIQTTADAERIARKIDAGGAA